MRIFLIVTALLFTAGVGAQAPSSFPSLSSELNALQKLDSHEPHFEHSAVLDAVDTSLLETHAAASSAAAAAASASSKYSVDIPELHLKSLQPAEDELLTDVSHIDYVSHLERTHPELTSTPVNQLERAFPQYSPKVIGGIGQQSFLEQQEAKAKEVEKHLEEVAKQKAEAAAKAAVEQALKDKLAAAAAAAPSLAETSSHTSAAATTETHAEAEAQAETEADAEADTEAEAGTQTMTMFQLAAALESQGMSESEVNAFMQQLSDAGMEAAQEAEHGGSNEIEVDLEVDSESHAAAQAEADAELDVNVDHEGEVEMDADADADGEMDADADAEMEADMEAEHEAEMEGEADMDAEGEEEYPSYIEHASMSAPVAVAPAPQQTITPVHSAAFAAPSKAEAKMHPAIKKIKRASAPAFGLPMMEDPDHSLIQIKSKQSEPKFDKHAIQLGPSKDAFGYVPMTSAEFLTTPGYQPASLAQVSQQYQNQKTSWLPPPPVSTEQAQYDNRMMITPEQMAGRYGQAALSPNDAAAQQEQEAAAFLQQMQMQHQPQQMYQQSY